MLIENPLILDPTNSYSFRDYFEMNAPADEIIGDFGLRVEQGELDLPQRSVPDLTIETLNRQVRRGIRRVALSNETARREAIVAPILIELADLTDSRIDMEYPIKVDQYLKGDIDYLLRRGDQALLVIEAKRDDLSKGFVQLATEMLAVYYGGRMKGDSLYGAVTIGNAWQFCWMNMRENVIVQDSRLYSVPDRLEVLARSLVGILQGGMDDRSVDD